MSFSASTKNLSHSNPSFRPTRPQFLSIYLVTLNCVLSVVGLTGFVFTDDAADDESLSEDESDPSESDDDELDDDESIDFV